MAEVMKTRTCCFVDCGAPATLEIYTVRAGEVLAGPDPYCDQTDSCDTHVGALLGWQPEAVNTEEIYWKVVSIRRQEPKTARQVAEELGDFFMNNGNFR